MILSQFVGPATGSVALISSSAGTAPNYTSVFGESATFTASIAAVNAVNATGQVTFFDGSTAIGTSTLTPGATSTATFTTNALSIAAHSITAIYGGDTHFAAGVSNTITQTVGKASTTTAVVTATPASPVFGQPVTFTTSVSVNGPGSGSLAGLTVTFNDTIAGTLGTATLNAAGSASLTVSGLSAATHLVTATFGATPNFNTSTSASQLSEVIAPAGTATTVASTSTPRSSTRASRSRRKWSPCPRVRDCPREA